MPLIRLAYASEATFNPTPGHSGVEPHVARILMASRRNNARSAVVGGLYYGNHRFFQYLEGEEDDVEALFRRIREDTRHENVKTLMEEPLERRTFDDWSMKYMPMADDVQRLLQRHGMSRFEPDRFDRGLCEEMIGVIRESQGDALINHQAGPASADVGGPLSPVVRVGLITAAVVVVAGLLVGGLLTLP